MNIFKIINLNDCYYFINKLNEFVFFLLCLVLSAAVYPLNAEEFIWPIDSPKSISSSFGEPRPGRFHYGVDFRSGGVNGKKVFAVGDGYISRITTGPYGYGKSLYITMDSGFITVYGHLSGYTPEIEERLFNERIKKKSYDIDLWPQSGEYRVSKGQVVAYSGDTGSGASHLHMEIRNRDNQPLNPFDHGINARDTLPPVISKIVLIPLDNSSTVDGYPTARWYDPGTLDKNSPVISGKIGIAVSVWDKINNSNSLLGVYTISLSVDSTEVFSKHYTKIPYDFNGLGGLDYLSGNDFGGNGYLSALFRRQGNSIDFYSGNGELVTHPSNPSELHKINITAADHAGNSNEFSFNAVYGTHPVFLNCGFTDDSTINITGNHLSGELDRIELWRGTDSNEWVFDRAVPAKNSEPKIFESIQTEKPMTYKAVLVAEDSTRSIPCIIKISQKQYQDIEESILEIRPQLFHDRIFVRISSQIPLSSLPLIDLERNGVLSDNSICTIPETDTSWVASIPIHDIGHNVIRIKASAYDQYLNRIWNLVSLEFTHVEIQSKVSVYSPDSLFSVTVNPGSLYRPAPVFVDSVKVIPSNNLLPVSQGYLINWGDLPLKKASQVRLSMKEEPPEGSALFVLNKGNNWRFLSVERVGLAFVGSYGSSGSIAVFTDRQVPYIKPLAPIPGGTIQDHRPLLKAYVEDKGSGIEGSDSISMSIDNITVYGEYDFEAHTVSYRLFNELDPGQHTVTVTVTDRTGNEKTRSWSFTIR
ncbi:MAG: M23 family metallopeptidase [Candidatus Latescibacteria bacterium]|nr:M23 family metallopeptidase [Candidatus Latescibacterota bacterium]